MHVAQQLGRYHLLDRVAVGGMAEIYRAKTFDSRGEEHLVAIKRVLAHLAEDDDFLQMLVDEAKIATLLDHPNIARVYEFVRVGDEYFIAMEYVDGRDLRSLMERIRAHKMQIAPEHAAYIMMRALDALHAAHTKTDGADQPLNIVHRDVSPSNVLVSFSGQVKLCDFGIAKARLSRVQTRVGVIKGKVKYMSPEQALGHPLDGRSDIFSCGSVFYELLTLQPPFTAENEMALIFRVRDAKTTRPSRINPNVPVALDKILRKMMNRSLGGRYATALDAAIALRSFLQDYAPDYTPSKLGRLLRKLFAPEIERDLRKLEDFVIEEANVNRDAIGQNLLAEVLGEGAPYTRFTPMPVATEFREKHEAALETRLMPRVPAPETRLPAGVDLHELKTEIFDPEEREKYIIKRKHRKPPGASHETDRRRETQAGTGYYAPPPPPASHLLHAGTDENTLDRAEGFVLGQPAGPPPTSPPPSSGIHLGRPEGPRPASLPSTARPSQSSRRPRPVGDPDESVPPNLHGAATQATPLPAPPRAGAPLTTDDIDLHGQTTHLIDLPDPEPDNDDDDATHG